MARDPEAAIARLKYRYQRAIDEDDTDTLLDCFTDDAVIDHVDGRGTMTGREEYAEWCRDTTSGAMNSMHMAMNPLIDVDGDEAAAKWNYLVMIEEGDHFEFGQGEYRDEYVRVDGEWKYTLLTIWRNFTIDMSDLDVQVGRGDSVTDRS
ncbi:MAG: nuclear transport factor 2 family protein [Salinirussus sp.]